MDRRASLIALGASAAGLFPGTVRSQGFGSRPPRFVVGYPVAGAADFVARVAADGLQAVGTTVVVENRPGAGGNIAIDYLARQPADSATFGIFPNSMFTTNPFVGELAMKSVNVQKDLVPVAALAHLLLALAVSAESGITSLADFLARARAPGQRLRLGVPVVGSPHHLSALLFQRMTGLDLTMVVYKGGGPQIIDAAGGHVDAVITSIPVGAPMVAAGKLRWIGIFQTTPAPSLPGVPPMADVLKGAIIPSWIGVWGPGAMPVDHVNSMNSLLTASINTPAVAARLRDNGMEPIAQDRRELTLRIAEEGRFMNDFLSRIKLDFRG